MNERSIRDSAGKTWSVMVRRVSADASAGDERAWAVSFRLQGDPTHRALTQILPDVDAPDLADYSEEQLLAMLEPHAVKRAELEAKQKAEVEAAKAAARAANVLAQAAKAKRSTQEKSA